MFALLLDESNDSQFLNWLNGACAPVGHAPHKGLLEDRTSTILNGHHNYCMANKSCASDFSSLHASTLLLYNY